MSLALGAAAPAPENVVVGDPVAAPSITQPVPKNLVIGDPAGVAELIRAKGYRAELRDAEGLPYIGGGDGEHEWIIFFFNCRKDKKRCDSLQFYSGFAAVKVNRIKINEWNRTHRFGRAYLDDVESPVIEMDVALMGNGISETNLLESLDIWLGILSAFEVFIRGTPQAEAL
jgi:hypothetical protein